MGPRNDQDGRLGGLPRPEIEERGDCVTVRFRRADYVPPRPNRNDLIERQEAILAFLDRTDVACPCGNPRGGLPSHPV